MFALFDYYFNVVFSLNCTILRKGSDALREFFNIVFLEYVSVRLTTNNDKFEIERKCVVCLMKCNISACLTALDIEMIH